jgi:aryl-alcohol dehydrogenase-like predicted oxidoreductase
MSALSRREFVKASIAVGAAGTVATLPMHAAAPRKATDLVTLGRSNMQVTRLAFGTGSGNGHVQSSLGQQEFTRLVHYAYDHGIRFFETSESYTTPAMLGEALKPFPRDSYKLMSKVTTDPGADPAKRFDDMLRTSQTDYFDILLLHYQHSPDWVATTKPWQDGVLAAQSKKLIHARGASVHGLQALRQVPGNDWLQIAMIRMNHKGTRMDGPTGNDFSNPDSVAEVVGHVKQVKKEGMGVISMKLVGEGNFTQREDRQAAMRFAFNNAGVDAVTVGFKSTQEIDEAIENLNLALA